MLVSPITSPRNLFNMSKVNEDELYGEALISYMLEKGLPESWKDTKECQKLYSAEQKGWKVDVFWDDSTEAPAGAGVFANQEIKAGDILRVGVNGYNIYQFNKATDFPKITETTRRFIGHYVLKWSDDDHSGNDERDMVFFWLPGCGFNHSLERCNIINLKSKDGVNLVATKNIAKGEELLSNYNWYGKPPAWFKKDWLAKHSDLECAFPGMNGFVKLP